MESLHYLLMRAHVHVNRWILDEAAELGLSPGQPKVLEFLLAHGESNQKAIASYCEIEPATVGSILLRMERGGLIVRTQRRENRRALYVSLTPRGRELGEKMEQIFLRADTRAASLLTAEEEQTLCRLLERVCQSVVEEME